MKELTSTKIENVVRSYIHGHSYSQIARQEKVSKGSVANVVADLRAGKFAEVSGLVEEVEAFRALAADLRRHGLSLGQASTGVAVVNALNDLGIDLSEVRQWMSLCRELSQDDADPHAFMAAALEFHAEMKQTGLDYQQLADKAKDLRDQVDSLEPAAAKLRAEQQALDKAQRKGVQLRRQATQEEQRLAYLRQEIETGERREAELAERVASWEDRAHQADVRLATARRDIECLAQIGLTVEGLTGFVSRVHGVAQHLRVGPDGVIRRLFKELETLDEGLTLESTVQKLRQRVEHEEKHLARTREQRAAMEAAVQHLKEERAAIQATIQQGTTLVQRNLRDLANTLKKEGAGFQQAMGDVFHDSLADAFKLEEQLVALGGEVGRCEGILEGNRWLNALMDLLHGEDPDAKLVRTSLLAILRATRDWVRRNGVWLSQSSAEIHLCSLITALEGWQP